MSAQIITIFFTIQIFSTNEKFNFPSRMGTGFKSPFFRNYLILSAILLIAVWVGCKKEPDLGNELSAPIVQLTIEEAKRFIDSRIHSENSKIELREDSIEVLSPEGMIQPDWNLAESYFDSTKMQSIVEVPLRESSLSRTLLNPENVQVDTATFFNFAVNHRLIVVRNADNLIDFAVMKIEGTYQYNLTRPDYSSRNSYKAMDPQFLGFVKYVDEFDNLKQLYYGAGQYFEPIDINLFLQNEADKGVDDRWIEICIGYYQYYNCPCEGHTWEQRATCRCSTKPRRVFIVEYCFPWGGPQGPGGTIGPIGEGGSVGGGNGGPTYNPQGGSGGSGGSSNQNATCLMQELENFEEIYGVDLLNNFEDIAYSCFIPCGGEESINCAIDALNAIAVSNSDGIIDILDNNGTYNGPKSFIPNCIELPTGDQIDIQFGITQSDNRSANQKVSNCLINALFEALQCLHSQGYEIESIYISSTTNGKHSTKSNHYSGLAIDISRINGIPITEMTPNHLQTVAALQNCLENSTGIRENFGPFLEHKLNEPYQVGNHQDHVHFSVNSNTNCNGFSAANHSCN